MLGNLITGGVSLGIGCYFGLLSAIQLAAGANQSGAVNEVGIGLLLVGVLHVVLGTALLVTGTQKKAARERYYERHPNAWLTPGSSGRVTVFSF